MSLHFLTGFPGFLASGLLPRLLARHPGARAVCLVEPGRLGAAHRRLGRLEASSPGLAARVSLVAGDIRRRDLGADPALESATASVTQAWHLAAIYHLSVDWETAFRTNVEGTRHVLAFAEACAGIERFHHVSTCYVSGAHPGVFREADLEVGQSFRNAYEETKYLAEAAVRRRREAGLPVTVYRPAIVVGDSRTGATTKVDGPYYLLRWFLRTPAVALVPLPGDPARTAVNVVPRDFVTEAMAHLSGLERSRGATYHLADPAPLDGAAFLRVLAEAADRRLVRLPVGERAARALLRHLPLGIPAEAVDYLTHPTRYDTTRATEDLTGSGIRVPPFPTYAGRLADYLREHPRPAA